MYLKSLAIYLVKLISCLIVIFRKLFLMFVHKTSLCVIFNIGVNTMFVKLDIRMIITNDISININKKQRVISCVKCKSISLRSEVKHLVASMLIQNLLHERRLLSIPKTLYLFLISEVFYRINKLRHRVLSSYKLYMSHQKLLCHQLMDTIYH